MTPILPRQLLWTEKKEIEEFFKIGGTTKLYYEAFMYFQKDPNAMMEDGVKIFNEVFYQATRMVYERPLPTQLTYYINECKADLGLKYSADLVIMLAYFLIESSDKRGKAFNNFFSKQIKDHFSKTAFWTYCNRICEVSKKGKFVIHYDFKPCPVTPEELNTFYVDWRTITQNYDLNAVTQVLELWDDPKEKSKVGMLIDDSLRYNNFFTRRYREFKNVSKLLNSFNEENQPPMSHIECPSAVFVGNEQETEELTRKHEREKKVLAGRIAELEAEVAQLKSLLSKEKNAKGENRKFTMLQIVDYCKGCVAWVDAKPVVAMLNKMLRCVGTEDDSKLVDSIEAEFMNRGNFGNIYNGPVGQVLEHVDRVENIKE